ncbi:unnamed protein product [Effrenium voratum]|nr:unnamed protein product [Effrenium voratum]
MQQGREGLPSSYVRQFFLRLLVQCGHKPNSCTFATLPSLKGQNASVACWSEHVACRTPCRSTKKKATDGELGGQKDWTVRIIDGLELDIEEPDLYIPTMGFVTYVVLYGLVRGIQEDFSPEVLSATISSALVMLILELALMKGALFMSGAVNTPTLDLFALLGYKFFYLSVHLGLGLLWGRGRKPSGFFYTVLILGLAVSCGVALWQALRRLARMQPTHGQECVSDMHQMCIKAHVMSFHMFTASVGQTQG